MALLEVVCWALTIRIRFPPDKSLATVQYSIISVVNNGFQAF